MEKFKIDYDIESDDLFLFSDRKSKGSIEIGNLVIDFDNQGKLVGIELLNATQFLKNSVDSSVNEIISRYFLSKLTGCEVQVKQQNNFLFIKITLIGKNTKNFCHINTPLIEETSPALAYT